MNKRAVMCSGCPFNPSRTGPEVPQDVMADVERRITAGEEWICHRTCDGAQATDRSSLCAGVVFLPQTDGWWIPTEDPGWWRMLTVCDETCHHPVHAFQSPRTARSHVIEAAEVELMLAELRTA